MEYIRSKPIKHFESIAEFLFKYVDLSQYKIQITESGGRKFPKMCFEIWTKEIDKPEELVFHLMVPKEEVRDLVIVVLPTRVCKLIEYAGKIL